MHIYTRKGMSENSVDICITCKGLSLWTYTHNKKMNMSYMNYLLMFKIICVVHFPVSSMHLYSEYIFMAHK